MPRKRIHGLLWVVVVLIASTGNSSLLAQHPQDTLHERAKKAGGKLVWAYRPNRSVIYPNVEELAKLSDIIVVGRALGSRPSLKPDGKIITENFLVRVQDVPTGAIPNGN